MKHISEQRLSEIADFSDANPEENAHLKACGECRSIVESYQTVSALVQQELKTETVDFSKEILNRINKDETIHNVTHSGQQQLYALSFVFIGVCSMLFYLLPINFDLSTLTNWIPDVPFVQKNGSTIVSIAIAATLMMSLERIYLKFKHS